MKKYLLLILLLLMCVSLSAQEEDDAPPPLIAMMQRTPRTITEVSYVDYSAIEQAGVPVQPESFAQFDASDDLSSMWVRRSVRIMSGPAEAMQYLIVGGPDMPDVVGFDFFDIDQGVAFGQPPQQGIVISGDFDLEAIADAHAARDYTENDINDVTVWCGPNGCDSGLEIDVTGRNAANYFDPSLGRKPPVLLLDEGILGSAFDLAVVENIATVSTGRSESLAESPTHRAIADALTDPEYYPVDLLQVHFIPINYLEDVDYTSASSQEQLNEMLEALNMPYSSQWEDYGDLPQFSLLGLADYQDEDHQSAIIALVYTNEDDAQAGAEEVARRLVGFNGSAYLDEAENESFLSFIEGAEVLEPRIFVAEDRVVALIEVTYPIVNDVDLTSEERITSGQMFRYWISSLYRRAFYPVWQIALPEFD